MKTNSNSDSAPTSLDISRPVADSMDHAIGEATTVMGAMVTELMRRSLRGGVLKIGEQLEHYVGERVDLSIAERRPAIEQAAVAVAEQAAFTTAAKVAAEEVFALEQRTSEADRGLKEHIEDKARLLTGEMEQRRQQLATHIEEKSQQLVTHIEQKGQHLATRIEEGDRQAIEVTRSTARELTGQIQEAEKRVSESAQAHVEQQVQALTEKAKEGAKILRSRLKAVVSAVTDYRRQLVAEHAALRADIARQVDDLRRENEALRARVAELEKPRGLRRLWAWLFRRGKK